MVAITEAPKRVKASSMLVYFHRLRYTPKSAKSAQKRIGQINVVCVK
jgi:hypothetical protein